MMANDDMDQSSLIKVNPNYCRAIAQLVEATKAAGDNLTNGKTKLALTSTILSYVNFGINTILHDGMEKHSDSQTVLSSKESLHANLIYLHDMIQKCTGLKLTHGHQTLQGNVAISLFNNLQVLEVRRIPARLLVGLESVRNRLTTIICARSLQTLKELFECCGADKANPTVWHKLNIGILSYNNIEAVDNSIKLLPNLEILDLSHNNIKNIENFHMLTKLKCLNISFNQLENFPLLPCKHQNLRCLILKNNNLDNIDGLSMFCYLEQLDLGYNCLSHHFSLQPLRGLCSLKVLSLDGNPLAHHHKHRKLTIENLHPAVMLEKFSLDGQYLNGSETSYLKNGIEYAEEGIWAPVCIGVDRGSVNSSTPSLESSINSGQQSLTNPTSQRQRRMRRVEFDDDNSSNEVGDSTCEKPKDPVEDYLKTKKEELEKLRNKHRSHWLVANTRMNPSPKSSPPITLKCQLASKATTSVGESERTLSTSEVDASNSETASISSCHDISDGINNNVIVPTIEVTEVTHKHAEDDFYSRFTAAVNVDLKKSESDSSRLDVSSISSDDEHEQDCPSFIVQFKTAKKSTTVILILKDNFLREKNVSGQTLFDLDLRSLMSSERKTTDPNCCQLTFQSIRKDCRERTYTFEDNATYKEFQDLIQPSIEENILKEMTQGAYQCFKCEAQFSKEVASVVVQKNKDGVHENVKVCPNCGSEVIMEVHEVALPSNSKKSEAVEKKITKSKSSATIAENLTSQGISSESESFTSATDQESKPSIFDNDQFNNRFNLSSKSEPNTPAVRRNQFSDIMKQQQQKGILESKLRNELFNVRSPPRGIVAQSYEMGSKSCGHSPSQRRGETSDEADVKENVESIMRMTVENDLDWKEIGEKIAKFQTDDDVSDDMAESYIDSTGNERSDDAMSDREQDTTATDSENKVCSSKPVFYSLKRCESDITILSNPSQSSISVLSTPSGDMGLDSITEATWEAQRHGYSANLYLKNIPFHSSPTTATISSEEDTMGKDDIPSIAAISDTDVMKRRDSFSSIISSNSSASEHKSRDTFPEQSSPSRTSTGTKHHDTSSQSTIHSLDPVNSSESIYHSPNSSSSSLLDERSNSSSRMKRRDLFSVKLKNSFESAFSTPMAGNMSQSSDSDSHSNKQVKFSYEDFTQLDHRLHLYLDMRVFQEGEQFDSVLQTNTVILGKGNEFHGLLILSNMHAYIYKIVGKELVEPKKWMEKVDVFPLSSLTDVRLHLASQAFSLEFNNSSSQSVCIFLLRDSHRCNNYFGYLTGCIKQSLKKNLSDDVLQIVSLSQDLMSSLQTVLTNYMHNAGLTEQSCEVQLYLMGYKLNGTARGQRESLSLVIASSRIFMIKENLQWIHCRKNSQDANADFFEIVDHENINDIVHLTMGNSGEFKINFSREDDGTELEWHISLETEASTYSFINAIRYEWEKMFGIDLPTSFLSPN